MSEYSIDFAPIYLAIVWIRSLLQEWRMNDENISKILLPFCQDHSEYVFFCLLSTSEVLRPQNSAAKPNRCQHKSAMKRLPNGMYPSWSAGIWIKNSIVLVVSPFHMVSYESTRMNVLNVALSWRNYRLRVVSTKAGLDLFGRDTPSLCTPPKLHLDPKLGPE